RRQVAGRAPGGGSVIHIPADPPAPARRTTIAHPAMITFATAPREVYEFIAVTTHRRCGEVSGRDRRTWFGSTTFVGMPASDRMVLWLSVGMLASCLCLAAGIVSCNGGG